MKIRSSLAFALLPVLALSLGLSGCGGSGSAETDGETDDTAGTGGTSGTGAAAVGAAHTIAITAPNTNAIENLGGGIYRRLVSAIVTDKDGNAVPDDTLVSLNVIDSMLATGNITTAVAGDDVTGSVLTDMGGGSFFGYGAGFDSAHIYRNDTIRYITPGDLILLVNAAEEEDKVRTVSGASLTNNTVTASGAYSGTYPNPVYEADGFTTRYVVGASLLGVEVSGYDSEGNPVTGVSSTVDGIASFRITYPANVNTIKTGCGDTPDIDTRSLPVGSADVYLAASVNSAVTGVSGDFCFSAIAGGVISTNPETITGGGVVEEVDLVLFDGGDMVRLPFSEISAEVEISGATLDVDPDADIYWTDATGSAVSRITINGGVSGDSATVTYTGNGLGSTKASGTVEITIP